MPADDSAEALVARFLRTNGYTETLDAFINEAGLPQDAGTATVQGFTIEKLLDEKRVFDVSQYFEKLGADDDNQGWASSAPATPTIVSCLPSASNILHVSTHTASHGQRPAAFLAATTADRRINRINLPDLSLEDSDATAQDSPVLSYVSVAGGYVLSASMSGQLVLGNSQNMALNRRRDHAKYIVKMAVHTNPSEGQMYLATAAWDGKVQLYRFNPRDEKIPAPFHTILLPSNPESLLFTTHPDTNEPILVVTRRDSTFLYYYTVHDQVRLLGRQNLTPHSNAWIAFTLSDIAICPFDPYLLAVATSAMPHMKLIIVRLLLPPMPKDSGDAEQDKDMTVASQARAALALQDREAAAIQIQVTTFAPQTTYSTPALTWRPDGSGVWVNGDDGIVRGIEAKTGKLMASLQGHDAGTKIRCLASAVVELGDQRQEWLMTGGFDHKLIVWKP